MMWAMEAKAVSNGFPKPGSPLSIRDLSPLGLSVFLLLVACSSPESIPLTREYLIGSWEYEVNGTRQVEVFETDSESSERGMQTWAECPSSADTCTANAFLSYFSIKDGRLRYSDFGFGEYAYLEIMSQSEMVVDYRETNRGGIIRYRRCEPYKRFALEPGVVGLYKVE
jgi:hypothetical protein